MPAWFPWLSVDIGADASRENTTGETDSQKVTLEPVDNPSRQLVELALHYLVNQPDRVWFYGEGEEWVLPDPDDIRQTPTTLAFIDFPAQTQFQPMACELSDGQVTRLS